MLFCGLKHSIMKCKISAMRQGMCVMHQIIYMLTNFFFLAHLSGRLRGAYSIGRLRRLSVVHPSVHISNDVSSETTGPIATKFHIQPTGLLGKKSCSNGLGHKTKMATMPIYGKNLKKSSSPKPIANDLET